MLGGGGWHTVLVVFLAPTGALEVGMLDLCLSVCLSIRVLYAQKGSKRVSEAF